PLKRQPGQMAKKTAFASLGCFYCCAIKNIESQSPRPRRYGGNRKNGPKTTCALLLLLFIAVLFTAPPVGMLLLGRL
ncbi:MAG: hypothetical protein Q4G07_02385, partial [Oscillospiraceae bacterium]|nr:hypothetical protein [Oscillospiraceae bacterium]